MHVERPKVSHKGSQIARQGGLHVLNEAFVGVIHAREGRQGVRAGRGSTVGEGKDATSNYKSQEDPVMAYVGRRKSGVSACLWIERRLRTNQATGNVTQGCTSSAAEPNTVRCMLLAPRLGKVKGDITQSGETRHQPVSTVSNRG